MCNILTKSGVKLDWSVYTYLTQLYDGRDMYIIYYIKNNYMFRSFTMVIIRAVTCSCSLCNKLYTYLYHHICVRQVNTLQSSLL